jgi:hypothetical protein
MAEEKMQRFYNLEIWRKLYARLMEKQNQKPAPAAETPKPITAHG